MGKYRVIISSKARQQIGQHVRFLANVNRNSAAELKTRFVNEIKSLETMPGRYPFFENDYIPAHKYHKLYVNNFFLVLYQIKDDKVYVDYVVDCREDYNWLL